MINHHNITHSLIFRNPRERMFVVQISLFIVKFLPLYHEFCHICKPSKKSTHTLALRHVWTCGVSPSYSIILLLMPLVECWCMHMRHHPRRPSGVDHTNGGEKTMNSNPIVSHATLILSYDASMSTLQNSTISCALWLAHVWYYGVQIVSWRWRLNQHMFLIPQIRVIVVSIRSQE